MAAGRSNDGRVADKCRRQVLIPIGLGWDIWLHYPTCSLPFALHFRPLTFTCSHAIWVRFQSSNLVLLLGIKKAGTYSCPHRACTLSVCVTGPTSFTLRCQTACPLAAACELPLCSLRHTAQVPTQCVLALVPARAPWPPLARRIARTASYCRPSLCCAHAWAGCASRISLGRRQRPRSQHVLFR